MVMVAINGTMLRRIDYRDSCVNLKDGPGRLEFLQQFFIDWPMEWMVLYKTGDI
jgi:hypothetical protein